MAERNAKGIQNSSHFAQVRTDGPGRHSQVGHMRGLTGLTPSANGDRAFS